MMTKLDWYMVLENILLDMIDYVHFLLVKVLNVMVGINVDGVRLVRNQANSVTIRGKVSTRLS